MAEKGRASAAQSSRLEEEEACFSDPDESEERPTNSLGGTVAESGYDFSRTVRAYAKQSACAACGEEMLPVWSEMRTELVFENACLANFLLYHDACARQHRWGAVARQT
ncbi:hypothetical protein AB1Y20_001305 [Prymnesium parvum]|uniref:Uncharacterized protein n=1 Tax=Prymnesium parvum TaxID=97485 RepID=A0AB34K7S4_PRYPA